MHNHHVILIIQSAGLDDLIFWKITEKPCTVGCRDLHSSLVSHYLQLYGTIFQYSTLLIILTTQIGHHFCCLSTGAKRATKSNP